VPILVEEAAEAVALVDLVDLDWCAMGERACRSSLPQCAVRPVIVVMALGLTKHGCGVASVEDQEAVEEFAADGPDEALGDRVRPRCPHRRFDDPDVDGGEDGVKGGGELVVAVGGGTGSAGGRRRGP
jgi:hypothetical protein